MSLLNTFNLSMQLVKQKCLISSVVMRCYAAGKFTIFMTGYWHKNIYNINKNKLFINYTLLLLAPTPKKLKKLGKLGPIMEKKEIPVETDANKLVSYVCGSNIMKKGEDIKVTTIQSVT